MKKRDVLKERILEVIQANLNNKKLIKETKEECIRKGLNINMPNLLWSDSIDISSLDNMELMAVSKSIRKVLKDNMFRLSNYFSDGEIEDYNNFINSQDKIDKVLLKGVTKIDDKNYHAIITAEQLSNIRKNRLVSYQRKYQRAGMKSKTSSGKIVEKIAINKQGVSEMQYRFLDKLKDKNDREYPDIKPTSIAFTVLMDELTDIESGFIFKEMYENIGDLSIIPNFDIEDETGIRLIISDGMHRYTALCDAFDIAKNNGEYLNEKVGLYIHLMTPGEAIQYLKDTFKRNDTDIDYLKSIESNEDTNFIYKFEKDSKWLNGHVANTKKEMNIDKNFVEYKTLLEAFKSTDIQITTDSTMSLAREKVAKIMDDLLDYTLAEIYNNNEIDFKNSIYFNEKMFKLYIKFAARVRKTRYISHVDELTNYIYSKSGEIVGSLNNKSVELNGIFDNIIDKVVR